MSRHEVPLNDVSTMNKTMEYMAHCLPSVSFDLVETRSRLATRRCSSRRVTLSCSPTPSSD